MISRRRAAPYGAALVASPVLRVSWAASGLSGALAALLWPCGLDLARSWAQLLPVSAAQPVPLGDLQAAHRAPSGVALVASPVLPGGLGGLAAALWPRSRAGAGAAAPDQRGAAGGLGDLQTAHRAPSGVALAALLRPCGLDRARSWAQPLPIGAAQPVAPVISGRRAAPSGVAFPLALLCGCKRFNN